MNFCLHLSKLWDICFLYVCFHPQNNGVLALTSSNFKTSTESLSRSNVPLSFHSDYLFGIKFYENVSKEKSEKSYCYFFQCCAHHKLRCVYNNQPMWEITIYVPQIQTEKCTSGQSWLIFYTHGGWNHLPNVGGNNPAWWHHCFETPGGPIQKERGFRNTGERQGRAARCNGVLNVTVRVPSQGSWLTTTTTSVSALRFPHVPVGTSHSSPKASFFSVPPTVPHQLSPSCHNSSQSPRHSSQYCSGDKLQHADQPAGRLSAVVSTVNEGQRGNNKCSKNVMCHRAWWMGLFGNNGDYFVQYLMILSVLKIHNKHC